jgi:hypothetical protein
VYEAVNGISMRVTSFTLPLPRCVQKLMVPIHYRKHHCALFLSFKILSEYILAADRSPSDLVEW